MHSSDNNVVTRNSNVLKKAVMMMHIHLGATFHCRTNVHTSCVTIFLKQLSPFPLRQNNKILKTIHARTQFQKFSDLGTPWAVLR